MGGEEVSLNVTFHTSVIILIVKMWMVQFMLIKTFFFLFWNMHMWEVNKKPNVFSFILRQWHLLADSQIIFKVYF